MEIPEDQNICPGCTKRHFCDRQPATVSTCDDFILEYSGAHWLAQKRSENREGQDDGEKARE